MYGEGLSALLTTRRRKKTRYTNCIVDNHHEVCIENDGFEFKMMNFGRKDIFLAALTMWTDNGAATLGAAWNSATGTVPPAFTHTEAPGGVVPPNVSYMNWNWSMVDTEVYGKVADSIKATGVAPRGTQLDCWWYPVQTGGQALASKHPFWCKYIIINCNGTGTDCLRLYSTCRCERLAAP